VRKFCALGLQTFPLPAGKTGRLAWRASPQAPTQ
jgi:hypothetical protein